ncbi:transcriptional regulator, ArsR family [Dethiosulfatibacter aminovorans DSM 17477]|uniref:Transcriptional regulator, ArsR family n=1 Tax=Dethiosulfatibacter aminovorans DSM 17477 TaxID=1121476 RepID=A0A1M6C0R7_9FIRM|nr:metalloregulator ArsR/SmtB family transcription factor [Dethiosulfatibacter aminovorans]SHI54639.1 transcriptional regulator, ArsR family [Dethiosulfatibacter aminovorans DSM 17477]
MATNSQQLKTNIYNHLARVGKALSSPRRLHLIDLLCEGPKTVDTLAKDTGMSVANTSQHLQTLLEARLVEYEKKGLFSVYKLSDSSVGAMFHHMQVLGESLFADIQKLLDDVYEKHGNIEQINAKELMGKLEDGNVTLIDVRPKEYYDLNHIRGASSVPLEELEAHLEKLPKDQEIIAYCQGRYCLLSVEAVEILNKHGYKAVRFEDECLPWDDGLTSHID